MLNCKDGLFFERLPYGDVYMVVTSDGQPPDASYRNVIWQTTISRTQMASIVAASSTRGYSSRTYHEAYELLRTEPPICAFPGMTEEADSGD